MTTSGPATRGTSTPTPVIITPNGTRNSGTSRHGQLARRMATKLCEGYRGHDERDRERAIAASTYADLHQFVHPSAEAAHSAGSHLVDGFREKGALEQNQRAV